MADRTLGAVDGTSLFACALCGVPFRFPLEGRYTAERLFYCFRHKDTTTRLEESRRHGKGVGADHLSPMFPIGVRADWQE